MIKNYSTSIICTLFICFFILLNVNKTFAQKQNIYEITDDSFSSKNISNNREEFYNLSQKLHPTLYFEKSKLKKEYGIGAPIKVTLEDVDSYVVLNQNNSKYSSIELITINLKTIADLNKTIDLSNNTQFSKLKYIYIKCFFNCDEQQVEKFIQKPNNEIRIFYTIINPS